ncbi:MAG TPA: Lrp/AsnC ligand binding domain-containing protein [Bacteroidales bacterium]|nr:Lrp/AsnC ligand binding domain-containing protein [Bacteroidales bacterium]
MAKIKLDAMDKKILDILIRNSKTSVVDIAKKCKISAAAIHKRINKLEEVGVIGGYRLVVNPQVLDFKTQAFIGIILERANMFAGVTEKMREIPEVVELHFTTGQYGILAKAYCRDNKHLQDVLVKIHNINGVSNTDTMISIEQLIDRSIPL